MTQFNFNNEFTFNNQEKQRLIDAINAIEDIQGEKVQHIKLEISSKSKIGNADCWKVRTVSWMRPALSTDVGDG